MLLRAEERRRSQEPDETRSERPRRLFHLNDPQTVALLAVGTITCVAFALRWIASQQSLFGDELLAYAEVTPSSISSVFNTVSDHAATNPPVFFLIAWVTAKLGDPTTLIRLPSALAGAATVPVVYLLGRMIAGRRCGTIAAALYAVMPFAIFYGSEARPYALVILLVSLSTLTLLKALIAKGQKRWWAAYWAICVLAFATYYTAAIAIGLQAVWALATQRGRRREILVVQAAVFLPFLPLLPRLLNGANGVFEPLALTLGNILGEPLKLLLGHPYATLHQVPGTVSIVVTWLAGVLIVAGILYPHLRRDGLSSLRSWNAGGSARIPRVGWLLVALTGGIFAVTLTYSELAPRTIYSARHMSTMLPYLCLTIGALAAMLRTRQALIATAAVVFGGFLGTVRELADYPRPDLRAAAQTIEDRAPPGTPVVQPYRIGVDLNNLNDDERPLQEGLSIYLDDRYPISHPVDPTQWPRGTPVYLVDGGVFLIGGEEAIAETAGARQLDTVSFDGFQRMYVTRYSRLGRGTATTAEDRAIGAYIGQHPDELQAYLDAHPDAKRRFDEALRARLGSGQ